MIITFAIKSCVVHRGSSFCMTGTVYREHRINGRITTTTSTTTTPLAHKSTPTLMRPLQSHSPSLTRTLSLNLASPHPLRPSFAPPSLPRTPSPRPPTPSTPLSLPLPISPSPPAPSPANTTPSPRSPAPDHAGVVAQTREGAGSPLAEAICFTSRVYVSVGVNSRACLRLCVRVCVRV